jgi:Acyl-CoA synthetases (AMP-forming)/AMP-acid ligases II
VVAHVIKADGSLAGYGEPGELVVKSPSAALGYFNDEQACVSPSYCNVEKVLIEVLGYSTRETFVDGFVVPLSLISTMTI